LLAHQSDGPEAGREMCWNCSLMLKCLHLCLSVKC